MIVAFQSSNSVLFVQSSFNGNVNTPYRNTAINTPPPVPKELLGASFLGVPTAWGLGAAWRGDDMDARERALSGATIGWDVRMAIKGCSIRCEIQDLSWSLYIRAKGPNTIPPPPPPR